MTHGSPGSRDGLAPSKKTLASPVSRVRIRACLQARRWQIKARAALGAGFHVTLLTLH
jgi:hypothetical protein